MGTELIELPEERFPGIHPPRLKIESAVTQGALGQLGVGGVVLKDQNPQRSIQNSSEEVFGLRLFPSEIFLQGHPVVIGPSSAVISRLD
jgi:hypothetical protein